MEKKSFINKLAGVLAITLILCVCVITGCANNQSQSTNSPSGNESASQPEASQSSADKDETDADAKESAEEEPEFDINSVNITEPGTVVVLATGGTIAGVGESGKATGYSPGSLTVEQLVEAVPSLQDVAPLSSVQICNVNSDDISSEVWIKLAKAINQIAENPNVAGFVITHGTDTMEETAYFLNLTVKTQKPVVITGSMRPSTATSADGPMNLYEAVCVAASDKAVGKGVLVAFSDRIYDARSVTKTSTYAVEALSAREAGSIGVIRDGEVTFYQESVKTHTVSSEFDVSNLESLPQVSLLYFSVDADPALLKYAAKNSEGLVIAGAGAGEFSKAYINIIKKLDIPVVISSRIGDGIITQDAVLCDNTVAANNLSPQKAAILLRLAIASNNASQEHLIDLFSRY